MQLLVAYLTAPSFPWNNFENKYLYFIELKYNGRRTDALLVEHKTLTYKSFLGQNDLVICYNVFISIIVFHGQNSSILILINTCPFE